MSGASATPPGAAAPAEFAARRRRVDNARRFGVAGVALIIRRSLRQHLLSTLVTMLAVGLASGLVMTVFSLNEQARQAFTGGETGFDAVLGARGSQLQLVLNTVFHLETSPGNLPWKVYEEIKRDRRVSLAIPYATGDNYFGYRLVGTTSELFDKFEYRKGRKFTTRVGRFFDDSRQEAVVGSFVARKLGLKIGDVIHPYHGLDFDPNMRHEDEYLIVGILEPTNSPSDRVIWIPIEGIFRMKGHQLRGAGETYTPRAGVEIPAEHKEVSAVMLKLASPETGFLLDQQINKQGRVATLAWPIGAVMADLFDKLGWLHRVLALVAYLVVVVAAASILASVYNTINERRREFAILRALGARRAAVFAAIVGEAATIATCGAAGGFLVYGAILAAAAAVVRQQTGVVLDLFYPHAILYLAPVGMIALGALAGVLPAWKAYATDVATNLTPQT